MIFSPCPKPEPRPKRAKRPVPKVNPVRAAKRYERDYGEKGDWIRLQPCCCTGKRTGERESGYLVLIVAAHFPSRGSGGRAKDLVPLADHWHVWGHRHGEKKLAARFGVDFKSLAAHYEAHWQRVASRRLRPHKDTA